MSIEYTKDDRIRLFKELCRLIGRRYADRWYDVGALQISDRESEGGYAVIEILDAHGKIREITRRMNMHEFHRFLESAIAVFAARDLAAERWYNETFGRKQKG